MGWTFTTVIGVSGEAWERTQLVSEPNEAPIRVLLIEDNPGDARLIQEYLSEAPDQFFVVDTVERLGDGLDRLGERPYEVVLLDLHLPDAVGLDSLSQIHMRASHVPVVVLTGLDDEAVGIEAMHQGAQDYVTKSDLTPEALVRSLRYAIGRHRTVEHLRMMSTVDELTGLNNRRGFLALAQQQLRMADRTGRPVLIIFADLDGLKSINDTWGHDEGDHALIETAEIVAQTFRGSDVIGRLGGDEFVVLMADCPLEHGAGLVERLQKNVALRNAERARRFELSLSAGLAAYDPAHPCSLDELLRRADAAMYEQKRHRKSRRVLPV